MDIRKYFGGTAAKPLKTSTEQKEVRLAHDRSTSGNNMKHRSKNSGALEKAALAIAVDLTSEIHANSISKGSKKVQNEKSTIDANEKDTENAGGNGATDSPVKQISSKVISPIKNKASNKRTSTSLEAPLQVREAVMKVIDELPIIEPSSLERMQGGGGFGDRALPPHHGEVEYPSGHELALSGFVFVVTGILDSLTREEAHDFVKKHGGRATGSVSSRTNFLVVGTECGESKLAQATKLNTKLINEDGLLALVRASVKYVAKPIDMPEVEHIHNQKMVSEKARKSSSGELWTEKYRPKRPDDLVGHVTIMNQLRHWLKTWDEVHLLGKNPTPLSGAGSRSNKFEKPKKAVLMCGSPGLGKTSSALLISKALGFDPVEINASDTRNQAEKDVNRGMNGRMANLIKEMVTNKTLALAKQDKRSLLIMDEVDGLAGNQDRGGIKDLIQTINGSKIPVICICNDKYSQKIRSLRNYCLELDFRKPTASAVRMRLVKICEAEGLQIAPAALEKLAESCNCDIRLAVNNLQMITMQHKSITFDTMKNNVQKTSKDLEMSPFTATGKLFDPASAKLSINQLQDIAFVDSDLIPLFIQENYLNYSPLGCRDDEMKLWRMSKASDTIADGDLTNRLVRMGQKWGLMPLANILGTVYPARLVSGPRQTFNINEPNFTRFTSFMGNLSSSNKQKRVLGELHSHMLTSGEFVADRSQLRLSYLSCFRRMLVQPLRTFDKEGISSVVDLMNSYSLTKMDFDSIIDMGKFKSKDSWAADPTKELNTQVKTAFTKEANKSASSRRINSGFLLPDKSGGKLKRARKVDQPLEIQAGMEVDEGVVEDIVDPVEEAEEDGDDDELRETKRAKLNSSGIQLIENTDKTMKGNKGSKVAGKGKGRHQRR